jgi:hypothetical protein
MKNNNYHEKRTAHWYDIVTSLLLKPHKHRLVDVAPFRVSKSLYCRSVPFKCANNFGSVLKIVLIVEFTKPNSRYRSIFFFSQCSLFLVPIQIFFRRPKPTFSYPLLLCYLSTSLLFVDGVEKQTATSPTK